MPLKNGTLNPLNVLDYRVVHRIPKHFESVYVDVDCDKPTLTRWIYTNLNSRFCVQSELNISNGNFMTESTKIGFEDPRELTMFMLTCPYLENRRNK
jgi:hypothetical protein